MTAHSVQKLCWHLALYHIHVWSQGVARPDAASQSPHALQEIADPLTGFSALLGEFSSMEVAVVEGMEGGCRVPYGARHLHQPIA